MNIYRILALLLILLVLAGCRADEVQPLPPDEYLENALNWIEAHAVKAQTAGWQQVRQEALAMASQPQSTADTYPAIIYALEQLQDSLAFINSPQFASPHLGILAVYPDNIIIEVEENSPAAAAGIMVGDVISSVNGAPPLPLRVGGSEIGLISFNPNYAQVPSSFTLQLQRGDETIEVVLEPTEDSNNLPEGEPQSRQINRGDHQIGYITLPMDSGSEMFPTHVQEAMAAVDGAGTCGWIIDVRNNRYGDLWSYLAALGPLLGEGELGGFVYPDGSQESWSYRDGKVLWAGEERYESYVRGQIYEPAHPSSPVALLIGPLTHAAGELAVVAFQGRDGVRTFGEPTNGTPHLHLHTPLSDGASLFVSGAYGLDRGGQVYNGPIEPDEHVAIDWTTLGRDDDPVIQAALSWLGGQSDCN